VQYPVQENILKDALLFQPHPSRKLAFKESANNSAFLILPECTIFSIPEKSNGFGGLVLQAKESAIKMLPQTNNLVVFRNWYDKNILLKPFIFLVLPG